MKFTVTEKELCAATGYVVIPFTNSGLYLHVEVDKAIKKAQDQVVIPFTNSGLYLLFIQ